MFNASSADAFLLFPLLLGVAGTRGAPGLLRTNSLNPELGGNAGDAGATEPPTGRNCSATQLWGATNPVKVSEPFAAGEIAAGNNPAGHKLLGVEAQELTFQESQSAQHLPALEFTTSRLTQADLTTPLKPLSFFWSTAPLGATWTGSKFAVEKAMSCLNPNQTAAGGRSYCFLQVCRVSGPSLKKAGVEGRQLYLRDVNQTGWYFSTAKLISSVIQYPLYVPTFKARPPSGMCFQH